MKRSCTLFCVTEILLGSQVESGILVKQQSCKSV